MKRNKHLANPVISLTIIVSIFLASAPLAHAQTDNGWSTPVNLSLSGGASNPVMVEDFSGTFHAIWLDAFDEGYKYSQSRDGVNWSQPVSARFPFGPKDPPPVLLADANGSIHVFWISREQSLFYGQATPFEFSDSENWKTTTRLARDTTGFDVVLDSVGALQVAYIRKNSTDANPAGVYYMQSIIGGGFWSEPRELYGSEYFRSAKQNDVYVRISASKSGTGQKIYVTWDNRAQKRVFMAVSADSGVNWGSAQQIKGPEDTGGIDTPFNLTVSSYEENVLLIWQAGEPGSSKCTVYSQWSQDGGATWNEPVTVLGGRTECPLGTKIVGKDANYMSAIFAGQVSPFMVAWNGSEWSEPQTETQLPSLVNPLTFDAVLLGCRFDLIVGDRLYVIGCDQGRGGDIWFLFRNLEPVADWFSPSVNWSDPQVLLPRAEDPEKISNFYTAADRSGNVHAMWVQSPFGQADVSSMDIQYARWDGNQWSTPESVIGPLSGLPLQLVAMADPLDRLLLTWIDGFNGDLVFSWANLERANLSTEWVPVAGLPTPSRLLDSSDIEVDGSGRIVNVYVIPVNEERGIYIVQSADSGKNWSAPVRVFDAVAEGWERVERPRISLGSDGVLHLIFVKGTVRVGQPVGLFYARSTDGGMTWSVPQILSEGQIEAAEIASYGGESVHVVWQEFDGLVYANVSQVSLDSGLTWGKLNNITGVNETPTRVALASDGRGLLHFIQLVEDAANEVFNQKRLTLQDWKWDGNVWSVDLTKDFILKGEKIDYSLTAEITSSGFLGVFVPVEYAEPGKPPAGEVLTFSRFLEDAFSDQAVAVSVLPTSVSESTGSETVVVQAPATPDLSILYDDNVSTSPLQRNAAGLVLVGIGVVVTLILLIRRRPFQSKK